ncbi:MAG: lytic transglycosylase domain-containing protein, partial [Betaproteobacteria bacterium]|nr:lytic transglycosylase domain-containing protein [Betaproteobacteria bacterium]
MSLFLIRRLCISVAGSLLLACLQVSDAATLSASPDRVDQIVIDMSNAYAHNDRRKLTQLLPQVKGHALEPWAAYWELTTRLDSAGESEIQEFFNRYK